MVIRFLIIFSLVTLSGCSLFSDLEGADGWNIRPDATKDAPVDIRTDQPEMTSDLPADVSTDLPADIPPDLPSDVPDDFTMLQAPQLTVTPKPSGVTLSWSVVPMATAYEVQRNNEQWISIGNVQQWEDAQAELWSVKSVSVTVSQGTKRPHVELNSSNLKTEAPSMVMYRVRAIGGQSSIPKPGRRTEGSLTQDWQRSNGQSFVSVPSPDTTADDAGTHHEYRLSLTGEGFEPFVSQAVEGWKLAVVELTSGANHHCARLSDGQMKCWGSNNNGQLGVGTSNGVGESPSELPPQQTTISGVRFGKSIENNTCVIIAQNKANCWGKNTNAQLGIVNAQMNVGDDMMDVYAPIDLIKPARNIHQGEGFACALMMDDSVTCWGDNTHGQLGRNNNDATYGTMAFDYPLTKNVLASNVKELGVGVNHACALFNNNSVSCWGSSQFGQLGLGDKSNRGTQTNPFVGAVTIDNAKHLFVGRYHNCIINLSGKAQCWGRNFAGGLGVGTYEDVGDDMMDMPPSEVVLPSPIERMSLGGAFTCALLVDGAVYCWGNNLTGVVADGTNISDLPQPGQKVILPGPATDITTSAYGGVCAIVGGLVYCWGTNFSGQLGLGISDSVISALGDDINEVPTTPVKLW
jgi:alpha-tubulin suppressor-like RCC1 family protein